MQLRSRSNVQGGSYVAAERRGAMEKDFAIPMRKTVLQNEKSQCLHTSARPPPFAAS